MNPARSTSRRKFLLGAGTSLGSLTILGHIAAPIVGAEQERAAASSPKAAKPIPFIHTTDLYNPPQDPDDHVDLATVYALPELDLRAVILDPSRKFLRQLDPGFVPAAQMNYLAERAVPVAAGPIDPLRSSSDTAKDRPRREQAGIELLVDVLGRSEEPAFVSVVGSAARRRRCLEPGTETPPPEGPSGPGQRRGDHGKAERGMERRA